MLTYRVGFYFNEFSDTDVKDLKEYGNYTDAMNDYLNRVKNDFNIYGKLSKSLAIGYYEDGKYLGKETIELKETYID